MADRDAFDLELVLLIGPTSDADASWTREQLRRGRAVHKRGLVEHCTHPGGPVGSRPWGFWVLDHGFEDVPDDEQAVAYLAEQGLLTEWERTELERLAQL